LTVLAEKDFKVRYRNSVLGFLWSLLNPLAYMAILTLVFSFMLRMSIQNFAAWMLIALLVWRFFQVGTSQGLMSIVSNPSLVDKVYLPRYLIVLSNNLANFVGSSLEFLVLLPLLVWLGVGLTAYAFMLPLLLALEFLLVFAISLWLSALNMKYRDFYQLWDIALQLGFFLTPIVYSASLIPARFQLIYSLNPVTRLIEVERGIFLEQQLPTVFDMTVILASILFLLALGLLIFLRLEKRFAEEL
jgi:ABC-type polysaccharide/polyol phosphate export permease